jgi:hypothetical protein
MGFDLFGSGYRKVTGSFEYIDEYLGSIQGDEFIGQLLKKSFSQAVNSF